MSKINQVRLSGTTYQIEDSSANKTVSLTQAQYDALSTKDPNTYYVITDASGGDLSNYMTSAQTMSAITEATSGKADSNSVYTKSETSGATQISTALADKLDVTAYTPTDLSNYYTKSETSGATEISTALGNKQDTLVSGTNIKTINNQSLLGSGNITIEGGGGGTVDPSLDITSPNAVANSAITTAINSKLDTTAYTPTDLSNYYTKSETSGATEISTALASKQTTLTAGTNITIVDNVISATGGGGGGGKAIEAGRGISVTTGETADTVSFNLPISAGTGEDSIIVGYKGNVSNSRHSYAEGMYTKAKGWEAHAEGYYTEANSSFSHAEGQNTKANGSASHSEGRNTSAMNYYSHAEGYGTLASNESEHASGQYNISSTASTTFGDSGNTLFSVGNGTGDNARHNAFEIRQNGDIYITSGGTDIKLQDNLGGGSVTVDSAISSSSTNPVQNAVIYQQFGGLKLQQITQSDYDALSTKDASTLYVIVN